jgi:hypothetical protein
MFSSGSWLARFVRWLGRVVGTAAALAAVCGVGAAAFGLLAGALFGALTGEMAAAPACCLYGLGTGLLAGALAGGFGALAVGDPTGEYPSSRNGIPGPDRPAGPSPSRVRGRARVAVEEGSLPTEWRN